jgi:DNA-binding winged helix-turn-helix (wHTH) protein/TolB-like protein/Tfp pilus assembly protein PilF
MYQPNKELYEFDEFRLNVTERILSRNGERLPLAEKTFETLCALVRRGNHLVSKEDLLNEVWADAIVEENNLEKNISYLRKILGENGGNAKFIETVRGHGYRFVVEVHEIAEGDLSEPSAVAGEIPSELQITNFKLQTGNQSEIGNLKSEINKNQKPKTTNRRTIRFWLIALSILAISLLGFYLWRGNAKPAIVPIKSIAVLPFKPLVADSRDEILELGMADTLISRLGNNREIIVRPLSSVRKFGNLEQDALTAGRALDVEAVLDGSVQRWGDKIRVNVQLVKIADGSLLWTETFDEQFTDIFVVQDAISKRVAAALTLQLNEAEQQRLVKRPTENVAAYQLYLKASFHRNKGTPKDLQKAVEYNQQAIALDPKFALAYVGLAASYESLAHFDNAEARNFRLKAKAATLNALALDDRLVESHIAFGDVLYKDEYDFAGAERELKRAIELDPNASDAHQAYGELLGCLGRHEEALAELRQALTIDPISSAANWKYSLSLFYARRYDEAIAHAKQTLELDDAYWWAHRTLAFSYQMKKDYAGSVAERALINEINGNLKNAALMRESFVKGGWQGFLRAMTGAQRPPNLSPYLAATFHAELGEKDKAFALLNQMYEDRDYDLVMLKVDPRFDSLRDDPRFVELLLRMNLDK